MTMFGNDGVGIYKSDVAVMWLVIINLNQLLFCSNTLSIFISAITPKPAVSHVCSALGVSSLTLTGSHMIEVVL
jgi:hypothetical protein